MKKTLLFALLLFFIGFSSQAQKITSFHGVVSNGYNFWVYTPADADTCQKPLILFLHGASLSGKDLNRVLRYGPLDALRRGRKIDAVVVAPQSPGGGWSPQRAMNVVDWVKAHYNIDTNRFYVIGMSMGGYGTLEFTGTYPDKVAAAMAFCGGANLRSYCGLNEVPLWILHGTADRDVHIRESEKVVNAMKRCGPTHRLIFTRLQGVNHGGPARAFYLAEPYEWLFSHNLQDPERKVNKNFSITPAKFHGVYDHLTRVDIPILQGTEKNAPKPNPKAQSSQPVVATTAQDSISAIAENNASETVSSVDSKPQKTAPSKQYHKVKQGETLGHIARKYHTSVKKICQLNGIKETTVLSVGKRLRVK